MSTPGSAHRPLQRRSGCYTTRAAAAAAAALPPPPPPPRPSRRRRRRARRRRAASPPAAPPPRSAHEIFDDVYDADDGAEDGGAFADEEEEDGADDLAAAGAAGAAAGGGRAEVREGAPEPAERPRTTTRYLTKYERARVLGARALQLSMNAPPMIALAGETDPLEIAHRELVEKKIPFTIRRYLPDGSYEDWALDELDFAER